MKKKCFNADEKHLHLNSLDYANIVGNFSLGKHINYSNQRNVLTYRFCSHQNLIPTKSKFYHFKSSNCVSRPQNQLARENCILKLSTSNNQDIA